MRQRKNERERKKGRKKDREREQLTRPAVWAGPKPDEFLTPRLPKSRASF